MSRLMDADELADKLLYETTKTYIDKRGYISTWRISDAIDEAPTIEQPKWISVDEALPECRQDVLMYFKDNMAVGFWVEDGNEGASWCAFTDGGWYTDCDMPLYWMPLPQPPKEGE